MPYRQQNLSELPALQLTMYLRNERAYLPWKTALEMTNIVATFLSSLEKCELFQVQEHVRWIFFFTFSKIPSFFQIQNIAEVHGIFVDPNLQGVALENVKRG